MFSSFCGVWEAEGLGESGWGWHSEWVCAVDKGPSASDPWKDREILLRPMCRPWQCVQKLQLQLPPPEWLQPGLLSLRLISPCSCPMSNPCAEVPGRSVVLAASPSEHTQPTHLSSPASACSLFIPSWLLSGLQDQTVKNAAMGCDLHVRMHRKRPEDNLKESVLFFYSVGLEFESSC